MIRIKKTSQTNFEQKK